MPHSGMLSHLDRNIKLTTIIGMARLCKRDRNGFTIDQLVNIISALDDVVVEHEDIITLLLDWQDRGFAFKNMHTKHWMISPNLIKMGV